LLNLRQAKQTKADYRYEETIGSNMHRYFSQISWAFAVHVAANGYCFRSSSIKPFFKFEFLGEHVKLKKQPTEIKVTGQKEKKVMDTSRANLSMVG